MRTTWWKIRASTQTTSHGIVGPRPNLKSGLRSFAASRSTRVAVIACCVIVVAAVATPGSLGRRSRLNAAPTDLRPGLASLKIPAPPPWPSGIGPAPWTDSYGDQTVEYETIGREHDLRRIHERAVERFVNSAGFGVSRLLHVGEPYLFESLDREINGTSESGRGPQRSADARPRPLTQLSLVSLLVQAQPEVYLTNSPPTMSTHEGTPTRRLDGFERAGLKALHDGKELIALRQKDGLRMIGAIRSTGACVKCHHCDTGALLGALTYTFKFE